MAGYRRQGEGAQDTSAIGDGCLLTRLGPQMCMTAAGETPLAIACETIPKALWRARPRARPPKLLLFGTCGGAPENERHSRGRTTIRAMAASVSRRMATDGEGKKGGWHSKHPRMQMMRPGANQLPPTCPQGGLPIPET